MARGTPQPDLVDAAWAMTRAAAALILHQMYAIEEQVLEPASRWATLKATLERFARTERPPS